VSTATQLIVQVVIDCLFYLTTPVRYVFEPIWVYLSTYCNQPSMTMQKIQAPQLGRGLLLMTTYMH